MAESSSDACQASSSTAESTSLSTAESSNQKNEKHEEIDMNLAVRYFGEGTRNMLVHDYSSAVSCFQEACKLFDAKYGIGAPECGNIYLHYGSALLELARLETGVIDGVVHAKVAELSENEDNEDDDDDDDDDEDDNEEDKKEENDDETKNEKESDSNNEKSDSKDQVKDKASSEEEIELSDEEKKDTVVTGQKTDNEINVEKELVDNCMPSTSKPVEKDEEDEDDNEASNMEVAWEVLWLAKEVFSHLIDQDGMKLKLAETLQKLGEISIEWENNQTAIDLLTQSLSYRKEVLSEDDRLIAETYYHLGLAFSFSNQCDNANDCYRSAIQVIENRIENQRKKLEQASEDSTEEINREIRQLEEILPEMKAKIEDSQDQMDIATKGLVDQIDEQITDNILKNTETKDKPVNDISHLIKRKRHNSDNDKDSSSKVLCSNGHNVLSDNQRSDTIALDQNITKND